MFGVQRRSGLVGVHGFGLGALQFAVLRTIGALIITYTILGVPYHDHSTVGPKKTPIPTSKAPIFSGLSMLGPIQG